MVCNYYLRTRDKEEVEYLIQCAATADSDLQAVQEFYNLNTNNIMEIDFKKMDGLVPAIVQDAKTLKVLMLGFMNEEAYKKTVETGKVTFYSRTRQTLWTKGETSGNFLNVVSMYPDCDMDTLLVRANPDGPTCHRGTTACFDTPDSEGFVRKLMDVIRKRHEEMPDGSYTTKLFIKGVKSIAKKVGEESAEAVIEAVSGKRDRFVYEASDLVYHFLVLMEEMGVSIEDLEEELSYRHR